MDLFYTGRSLSAGIVLALMAITLLGCKPDAPQPSATHVLGDQVELTVNEDESRVEVRVGGELFTAYYYPGEPLKKPVLYPINTASGLAVTRGYPLDQTTGERADHPHHVGFWLNYGDVNGLDFWNNSDAVSGERAERMGTIVHSSIDQVESGDPGMLDVTMEWQNPDGETLLREETRFVFHAEGDARMIDRITTLTALDDTVHFTDNKEGMVAVRVTRALEHPENRPVRLTGPDGQPTEEAVVDSSGVTGFYRNAEGVTGTDVWGKRAPWTMLSGVVQDEPVTLALFDHPDNVGYPTYWHARGYGLFSANPLGQKEMSEGAEELNFALDPGQSTTFRYRLFLTSGSSATPEDVQAEYDAFVRESS